MYFYAWSYRCLERHDGNSGKEWSYEKDCKDNVSLYPLAISIMPFQTPITPSIKIHKFTASVEDEIKLSVICPIVP